MDAGANLHVVIMAGGVGKRLWPLSRRSWPKQFQSLFSERSMIEETYERVLPLSSPERVWVVTGADFVDLARSQLPDLPPANVLGEPVGRSSAAAVALAAARIARREPEAIVLATAADSHIGDAAAYRDYVTIAVEAAGEGFIVVLGVTPSRPDTGYGYIQRGECLDKPRIGAYRVERFAEKPDEETAEQYLADGRYYWNMGHFIFGAEHFMARCAEHLPEVAAAAQQLSEADDPSGDLARRLYDALPSISLDYGIAEKEARMAVVPAALEWSDVGNWRAVKEIVARYGSRGIHRGNHIEVGGDDCFVMGQSGRLVVTVGADGYIVVDTPDALLIVHEDMAQDVREALEEMQRRGDEEHL